MGRPRWLRQHRARDVGFVRYLTEAETADALKVNAALTKFVFRDAYKEAPERMPKSVNELLQQK